MYAKFLWHYSVIFGYTRTKKKKVTVKRKKPSPFGSFLFIAILITALLFFFIIPYTSRIIAYLVAVNISTFALYAYDKFVSSRSGLRVSENILHMLELFGGSPSALLAQHLFRHKVSKSSFQWIFWGIVLFQGAAYWYFKTVSI